MSRSGQMKAKGAGGVAAATGFVLLIGLLTSLTACSSANLLGGSPEPPTPADVAAPSTVPPPVDIAGRWQFSAAAGGACTMNFGGAPGGGAPSPAPQGTIAPGGGCPGNFFMSRKWTFEN
ncbi:MAG TPA: hypothetical protein VMA30_16285, partial [Xanthobacteraceae bacterium]|nr:hypothetical protein [Xanthobacteraceae bacterium]